MSGAGAQQAAGDERVGQSVGQLYRTPGGQQARLGISADDSRISDAVSHSDMGDAFADGFHDTRTFDAKDGRHGKGIDSLSLVDVDEVHARASLAQTDCTGAGIAGIARDKGQVLHPAGGG